MATKLHQILAIERSAATDADRQIGLATRGIEQTGDQSPLTGISRTYEPRTEDGDQLPSQYQHVQLRVKSDVLPVIARAMTRFLDVKFTREEGGAQARADVKLRDGTLLLADVPVTYLLGLEEQLSKVAAMIKKLPVLDPSEEWHWDAQRGCYATEPRKTVRAIRVPQVQIMSPAQVIDGKAFDAQVRPYETEKPVGDWTTIKLSGALPFDEVQGMHDRAVEVLESVKMAREEANRIDVQDRRAGEALFGYIFGS